MFRGRVFKERKRRMIMTKRECLRQIKKLLWSKQKNRQEILKEVERLINSGGIDLSREQADSFYVPKIILSVALKNLSKHFTPVSQSGCEVADNLELF